MAFLFCFIRSSYGRLPGRFNAVLLISAAMLTACFPLASRPATADSLIVSRSVTVEGGYDSDKSIVKYLDTQLQLGTGYWIYLAAQKNDVKSEDGFDLDSRSYFAGFSSDPDKEWGYELTYENWGNPGDIETDAIRGIITWRQDNWALSFLPQYRDITLSGVTNGDSFDFHEYGTGARIQYLGIERWILSLERSDYNFSKDPRILEDTIVNERLTFTATSLASGVYDYETVIGIEHSLDTFQILLEYTQEKLAIDNTLVNTIEANVDYYFSDNVIPYLRIGRASFSGISPLLFGNIGVQFTW